MIVPAPARQCTVRNTSRSESGYSLIEVLLAGGLLALLTTIFVGAILYGQESTVLAGKRARAVLLAAEGLEATRNIRDAGFANLTDGTHGLALVSNQWTFSGTQDVTDIFSRTVTISSVDADRKDIMSQVTWQQNPQRTGTLTLDTRLTNWGGTTGGGGLGWQLPLEEATINLSGSNDGVKVQVQGDYAYLVRTGTSNNFIVVDVSDPANPTTAATLSIPGVAMNVFVTGTYAYVASGNNTQELQIINIATPSAPSLVGSLNLSGTQDAFGIFAVGNTVYLTRDSSGNPEFYVIDVSLPAIPTLLGSLQIPDDANEVVVSGTTAYVATSVNTAELTVVDVAIPSLPAQVGTLDISGSTSDARTITLTGTTALIGLQSGSLHTINVAVPSLPVALGSVSLGANAINDIAVNLGLGNTLAFVATENADEFQVVSIAVPAVPVVFGTADESNDLRGVAYDTARDRAYAASTRNNEEFVVYMPSP